MPSQVIMITITSENP